jgi:transcriptional regulator with PAS, ATPase and Fis domain
MPRSKDIADSLTKLLDQSSRPIYVVDAQRRIVYCNAALAAWIDLEPKRIVGRRVEFHSEAPNQDNPARGDVAPLTDLCPPPGALAGEDRHGTISCQARDGHMRHRTAEFVPLARAAKSHRVREHNSRQSAVLVLLAEEDLSPQQLAAEVSGESSDELHRTIRRFRRGQAQRYSIKSLLGSSAAMQKVRAQVEAAAASGANVLILGPRGSGRSHVARAIHYATANAEVSLLPINCEMLTDELWERTLEKLRPSRSASMPRTTLILENLECIRAAHAQILASAMRENKVDARIIATLDPTTSKTLDDDLPQSDRDGAAAESLQEAESRATRGGGCPMPTTTNSDLLQAISTLTIRIPRLVDRLEDLPVLAQFFVESCNRGNSKQVESLRSEALDSLALYSWPGEIDQLREMIEAAHAACTSHQITVADLPATLFHAARAAAHSRPEAERIVLDELLAAIEREAIVRALSQAGGNKSEAAALLGMTRPRLYRRLVQLGLAGAEPLDAATEVELPEFIETDVDQ